jgi:hypothetical protein
MAVAKRPTVTASIAAANLLDHPEDWWLPWDGDARTSSLLRIKGNQEKSREIKRTEIEKKTRVEP